MLKKIVVFVFCLLSVGLVSATWNFTGTASRYYTADDSTAYPDTLGVYNGTINNIVFTPNGKINGARINYAGTNNWYITTAALQSNLHSVSFWLINNASNNYFFKQTNGFEIYISGANTIVCGNSGASRSAQSTAISLGVFHHIICVYNASYSTIYIDGINATASNTLTETSIPTAAGSMYISSYSSGGINLKGTMDEILFSTTAFNAADAAGLYNNNQSCQIYSSCWNGTVTPSGNCVCVTSGNWYIGGCAITTDCKMSSGNLYVNGSASVSASITGWTQKYINGWLNIVGAGRVANYG